MGRLLLSKESESKTDNCLASAEDLCDSMLVQLGRHNRAAAFSVIVDRYHEWIYSLICHICGSSDAEDLTQDVFVSALINFPTFRLRGERSLRNWLARIATNAAINELRHRRRRERHEDYSLNDEFTTAHSKGYRDVADTSSEPHRCAELSEILRTVHAAIQALPPHQREALVLVDLEQRGYEEAARIIGCRVGTLKSRLSRARDVLAAKIRPQNRATRTSSLVSRP